MSFCTMIRASRAQQVRNPLAGRGACGSRPPFPKHGRVRLIDFPIEKIIIAGPRVDLGPANLAAETARMLVWMPLPCRDVRQPAIGTVKKFGRPDIACHACKYPHPADRFKPFSPPPLTTYYPSFIKSVSPSQSTDGAMTEIGTAWLLVSCRTPRRWPLRAPCPCRYVLSA
jgi:hypothetical protein